MAGADAAGAEHEALGRPTTVVHLITTLSQGGAERVLSQVVPRPAEHPGERHVVVSLVAGGMFCDELVATGHPSKPGFNDQQYPIEGRVSRA